MKGFKGFDKDLRCHGMQYAIRETAKHSGTVRMCNSGLHFVEHPLDALTYYPLHKDSRYAEIEADGVSSETERDSKRVAQSLIVTAELKIPALIKAAVESTFQKAKPTTGDAAHSATTGHSAHSATTGNSAHSATTGYFAHSATTGYAAHSATTGDSAHSATTGYFAHSSALGKNTIAAALGYNSKARGAKGSFLVLAEYKNDGVTVKAVGVAQVRGKIRPDTWYALKNGKFTEVPE